MLMRDYSKVLAFVVESMATFEYIGRREHGAKLLHELYLLAGDYPQAFDWLVGREGGLLDQVLAAFPEKVEEADEAPPAGELIPFVPRGSSVTNDLN